MTLKVEAGKFYRTRDGRKVGPMFHNMPGTAFPFDDGTGTFWRANGICNVSGESEYDLIAEWTDEDADGLAYQRQNIPIADTAEVVTMSDAFAIPPEPAPRPDMINHPPHYTSHPSGVECIQITECFDFVIGNIIKYAWRAGLKEGASRMQDLEKCRWYAARAVEREAARGDSDRTK